MSKLGRNVTHYSLSALESVQLVPKGTTDVHFILLNSGDTFIRAGKMDIVTPMFITIARKPE